MMKNNKGFSLVELIIVVAVMAILVGVIAPMYLQYVAKAKRTVDARNAEEVVRAMDKYAVFEDSNSYSGTAWTMQFFFPGSNPKGDSVYARAFRDVGGVPESKINDDLLWGVFYYDPLSDPTGIAVNLNKPPVKKVYLVKEGEFSKGYELYPNPGKYIQDFEMVPITLD